MSVQLRLSSDETLAKQAKALHIEFQSVFTDLYLLSEEDVIAATHQTRKALKLYRAVLKLLKNCLTNPDTLYNNSNIFLRDLGREFSDLRDAHVRSSLLNELNSDVNKETGCSIIDQLLESNNRTVGKLQARALTIPNQFKRLADSIANSEMIRLFFQNIDPQKNCILAGLEKSYNKSEEAFLSAENESRYEAFHEWRKRLKDVQNQLKILLGEESVADYPFYVNIDEVCEELGYLNDLAMLSDWLSTRFSDFDNQEEFMQLTHNIDAQTEEFLKQLVKSGNRFYTQSDQTLKKITSAVTH